ncbi:MAG: hypothetical protein JWN95_2418 [Frankiales bacterium]|nr:hypothetical protein [Frankiales bacterium]
MQTADGGWPHHVVLFVLIALIVAGISYIRRRR